MEIKFPGFFDLQVNGFAGVDFNDPESTPDQLLYAIGELRATGVTRFLPTLITSSLDSFSRCAERLINLNHPAIAGIHMEGPYISPVDGARGAHPRAHVRSASHEDFACRQEAAKGQIRLVTLAPEVPGALSLTQQLVDSGVRVAIGHTACSPEEIHSCIRAGATLSTHLGNGCTELLPRHPNFIWEQLAADDLYASLIVDGHHLPPSTVKSMVRAKTPPRTILVTDAITAAGCPPGSYKIGELHVEVSEVGRVSVPGATHLAGSALTMPVAVANTVRFTGLSIKEVLPMATTLPAQYIGAEVAGEITGGWDETNYCLSIKPL